VFKSRLPRLNTRIDDFSNKEIKSDNYSIVLESKNRELYLQIINTNLHMWNIFNCLIFKLEILCLQHNRILREELKNYISKENGMKF